VVGSSLGVDEGVGDFVAVGFDVVGLGLVAFDVLLDVVVLVVVRARGDT
jgi:hypothetical protein